MREFFKRPRTVAGSIIVALAIFFFVLITGMLILDFLQPPAISSDAGSGDARIAKDNFILGMAILGIVGTFGIIAYYYKTIGFGSGK